MLSSPNCVPLRHPRNLRLTSPLSLSLHSVSVSLSPSLSAFIRALRG